MTPDPLNRLVAQLARLPGIGEKTAQRLAFHILRAPPEYARELSAAIQEVKEKVHLCARCFSLTEQELCGFCRDDRRDERVVCVVENVAAGYIDPLVGGGTKDFAPYVLMILALMVRPYGMFGKRIIERV